MDLLSLLLGYSETARRDLESSTGILLMRYNEESWTPIAQLLGFDTEEEMLKHFYMIQSFSIKQISQVIGYSTFTVRRRLLLWHVNLRKRGGANHQGKRILRDLTDAELFDGASPVIAEKYNVHVSTISAERRFRKGEMRDAILSNNTDTLPKAG